MGLNLTDKNYVTNHYITWIKMLNIEKLEEEKTFLDSK